MRQNFSTRDRVTLAPRAPSVFDEVATAFHSALSLFNSNHGTDLTWDELTEYQQLEVRVTTLELHLNSHVCRKRG